MSWRVDRRTAARIVASITRLADSDVGDVKKLAGSRSLWRLRVGDLRVLYVYDQEGNTLSVRRILHRARAYRD